MNSEQRALVESFAECVREQLQQQSFDPAEWFLWLAYAVRKNTAKLKQLEKCDG